MIEFLIMALTHVHRSQKQYVNWIVAIGILFVTAGCLTGGYFLFMKLTPLLGQIEAGMSVSVLFMLVGGGCILACKRPKQGMILKDLNHFKTALEKLPVKTFVQEHKQSMMVCAFVLGVALALLRKESERS